MNLFACSDFIDEWVNIAQPAKLKVKAEFGHLPPEEQLALCVQVIVDYLNNIISL